MKKYSFPKHHHLTTQQQFSQVFATRKISNERSLRCYYKKNTLEKMRIGIVVSKKFGNAYKRNQFKRFVRESFRLYPDTKCGVDIIILPNYKNIQKSIQYADICSDMWKLLRYIVKKIEYAK